VCTLLAAAALRLLAAPRRAPAGLLPPLHKTVGGRVAQVKELNCPDGPPCDELMMGLVIWVYK
jgi:hypothetical protein